MEGGIRFVPAARAYASAVCCCPFVATNPPVPVATVPAGTNSAAFVAYPSGEGS